MSPRSETSPKYLFLAVPNFCGSTLLHNLLETCPEVVPLTDTRPEGRQLKGIIEGNCCVREGYRNLNGPHSIEANMEHVYADPANYDWPRVKRQWDENWARTNPTAPIRMQKTPADIFRVRSMLPHFDPLRWIIMVRNPYNHVESIMRKATFQMDPVRQLDQICYHAIRCLEVQMENVQLLGAAAYTMRYEDFCAQPEFHREQLGHFMPGLEQLNFEAELWLKGARVEKIHDDSAEKLKNLVTAVPDIIPRINEYFSPYRHVLDYWGYPLLGADGAPVPVPALPDPAELSLESQLDALTQGFERTLALLARARTQIADPALQQEIDHWTQQFNHDTR